MMIRPLALSLLMAITSATIMEAAPVPLVRNGEPAATVLISDETEEGPGIRFQTSTVEGAAQELIATLRQISGAELPLSRVSRNELPAKLEALKGEGRSVVLLGSVAGEWLGEPDAAQRDALSDHSGFVFRAESGVIGISGGSPRGTEIGVHELLEQLGVRWFLPGELGTVIPSSKEIAIEEQTTVQKPTFPARHFGFNAFDKEKFTAEWKKHQREGGLFLPPAHGIPLGEGVTKETHPQFYAKTERIGGTQPQICLTHAEVLPRAIEGAKRYFRENPDAPWIGMGPADGAGFCECEGCKALDSGDWDPFSSDESVTDRYVWFFNQVLDGIADEFPDKKIAFYVYHCYIEPPVKVKPNPRIVPAIAPIGLCRIHGMNNPVCPERGYLKGIISAWTKILPEVYERGYWFNLADPGIAFIQIHRMRDEIPYYAEHGVQGFRTECTTQWGPHGPSLYIAARLMWDAKADPDALLKDFCEKFFGPAAGPMEEYFTRLDTRMKDADHHTGSAFNAAQIYPPEFRKTIRAELEKARNLATASPYRERVEIFDRTFAFTEHFTAMIEARDAHDWAQAHRELEKLDELRTYFGKSEPAMLSGRQSEAYLRRFFRIPVEQGFARATDGNRLVAPLKDEWEAQIDSQQIGGRLNYERPDITGGNWQVTPTFSTTWSDIGLRYYKGLAWYRQTVEIPEADAGKRMFLWFGGVDESARVWVNGKLVGTSVPSAFTPFELDATEAVKPGKNVVTICVANLRTNELGTGGITAPAFFYAPAAGDKAQLDNLKPLRETFP